MLCPTFGVHIKRAFPPPQLPQPLLSTFIGNSAYFLRLRLIPKPCCPRFRGAPRRVRSRVRRPDGRLLPHGRHKPQVMRIDETQKYSQKRLHQPTSVYASIINTFKTQRVRKEYSLYLRILLTFKNLYY